MLTIVVTATILGGVVLTTVGADTGGNTSELIDVAADAQSSIELTSVSVRAPPLWKSNPPRRHALCGLRQKIMKGKNLNQKSGKFWGDPNRIIKLKSWE